MRPRQHDRFVLIGLCWLYGRSEFPPSFSQIKCRTQTEEFLFLLRDRICCMQLCTQLPSSSWSSNSVINNNDIRGFWYRARNVQLHPEARGTDPQTPSWSPVHGLNDPPAGSPTGTFVIAEVIIRLGARLRCLQGDHVEPCLRNASFTAQA